MMKNHFQKNTAQNRFRTIRPQTNYPGFIQRKKQFVQHYLNIRNGSEKRPQKPQKKQCLHIAT